MQIDEQCVLYQTQQWRSTEAVNRALEVVTIESCVWNKEKWHISTHYSLQMGNMMISDLCCEPQLQQTHTHPPIHRKRTHSCSHASSAYRFCCDPRVERGISHGKVEGANPTGPLPSATVHWSAVVATATHTKIGTAQLHTAASVLCFPIYSE